MKRFFLAVMLTGACLSIHAQEAGTVTFGNDSSCLVSNAQTGGLVTASDGILAALYWAPLGEINLVQIGAAVTVGVPLDGLFAGGTREATNPATAIFTPGGTSAQFQVRAWPNGFATCEAALSNGASVGLSSILVMPTGDPGATPPTPPISLTANGLQSFAVGPPIPSQTAFFFENFTGSALDSVWQANLPNAPVAAGPPAYTYIGASSYFFTSLGGSTILRMTNFLGPLQRRGWSSVTNFSLPDFRYEVRFNTLTQSAATSIDAFVELWVLDAADTNRYDIVSLFGANSSSNRRFMAGSSIDNAYSNQPFNYQDSTWYRLVLEGAPGQNVRASLLRDDGMELIGRTFAHGATAFGSGFKIVLAQAVGAATAPVDVAVDFVKLTSGGAPPAIAVEPQSQAVTQGSGVTFAVAASGTPPLSYQWIVNGTNITGATSTLLALVNVQPADAGSYSAQVSNSFGSTNSADAVLTVLPSATNCVPAPAGVVAWLAGEGDASDSLGGSYGVAQGSLAFASGQVGQCFVFNGSNASVRVAANSNVNVGLADGFTFETWINPASVATQRPIVEWNSPTGNVYGVHFWISAVSGAGPGCLFANLIDAGGVEHRVGSAAGLVTTNVFQHVALTYDKVAGLAVIYLNGTMVAQQTVGSFTPQTAYDIYLGLRAWGVGSGSRWLGQMDEVSLYNRALAPNEIAAISGAGSLGKCIIPAPPSILSHPADQTVIVGGTALLNVCAGGAPPLSYQWSFNGTNIPGATTPSLTLTSVTTNAAGLYAVEVTNSYGAALSSNASLTVIDLGPNFFDDFEPGIDLPQWASFGGTVLATNYGGFVSGSNSLWFGGTGSRQAITRPLNTASGGAIQFHLRIAGGTSYPWEKADLPGEGIVLEYSTNGESNWVQVGRYDTGTYTNWSQISVPIPAGAQAANAQFRWRQLSNSGSPSDHWALDDVMINTGPTPPVILAQPQSQAVVVGDTQTFSVTASGTLPLNYQWKWNGTNLVGATSTVLALANVQLTNAGTYAVVVTNSVGSTNSADAVLTVLQPPTNCVAAPSGLVSWWRAEGNAVDEAGGNLGTLAGNAVYGAGLAGQCFAFDGYRDAVRIGNPTNLHLQNFTIETWIKRASPSVVSYDGNGNGNIFCYSYGGYGFYMDTAGRPSLTEVGINGVTASGGITDTNWHHLAVTKSGSMVVFYIDGVAHSAPAYDPGFTFTTELVIGAWVQSGILQNCFYGSMDELAVYSRALATNEIAAIYYARSYGKCSTPVPPSILTQPTNQTVVAGGSATFAVTASGTAPLSYQWLFNGTNLGGATSSVLTLAPVQLADAGTYVVQVGNAAGSTISSNAVLSVILAPYLCDAALGFSTNANPAGVWSYGYALALGGPLTLCTEKGQENGVDYWRTNIWLGVPAVYHNGTSDTLTNSTGTMVFAPGQLGFHPGPNGEYCIIRFTVPSNGQYQISGLFAGLDTHGTTTDVHILTNGILVFDGWVNGFGAGSGPAFNLAAALNAGEHIDFAVGKGSNDFSFDVTGISAQIALTALLPTCTAPPAGLVSWWQAEVNAADVLGNNPGTLKNGAGFGAGKVGQAFDLNGINQYVELANSSSLNPTGSFSIEGWILPRRDGIQEIFVKWGDTGDQSGQKSYYFAAIPNQRLRFGITDAAHMGDIGFEYLDTLTNAFAIHGWSHVAAVYDQPLGMRRIYVNGVKQAERVDSPITVFNGTAKVGIGAAPTSSTTVLYHFDGLLDEVGFYAKALSEAEVQAIYHAGSAGKCTTPVPPSILAQPTNQTVVAGGSATFTVTASGTGPLSYQWRVNGTNIAGGTASSLTLTNVQVAQAGIYAVQVTNVVGSTNSAEAVLTVNPPPPCAPLLSGIVSWWQAEANAADALGTNPGTLKNGASFSAGKVGQAFDFSGASQYVEVPNRSSLSPTGSFSIEGWIYPRQDGLRSIMAKWGYPTNPSNERSYAFQTIPNRALRFAIADLANQTNAAFQLFDTGSNAIAINEWSHVAAVYDQTLGARRIYVNGVKVAERIDPPITVMNSPALVGIGAELWTSTTIRNPFNGLIDELSFYGKALSDAEVLAVCNAGSAGKCSTPAPPSILTQPTNQTVVAGGSATFTVTASGTPPLSYQWNFNGTDLPGATATSLTLTNVQATDAGTYAVLVTNAAGSTNSANAVLIVTPPPTVVRVASVAAAAGQPMTVPIQMVAIGNENALGFSLNFDPGLLSYGGASVGTGAIGATLIPNTNLLASGKLGFALAQPAGMTFAAGTQEVVLVEFTTAVVTNVTSATIAFGDQPLPRELSDAPGNMLAATYVGGTVSIAAADLEADVSPRPNGDKALTITDWVLVGRYVARLDYPTNAGEFQRADCAPRAELGDGALKVTDWVQAGRYYAGLDPLGVAGGPAAASSGSRVTLKGLTLKAGGDAARLVQVSDVILMQGQTETIAVNLEAQGDENALGFSLAFDPAVLEYSGTTLGAAAGGATLNLNTERIGSGNLGIVLAMPTETTFAAGTREVVKVNLRLLSAATGSYPMVFSDQPVPCEVSDAGAVALAATYESGMAIANPIPPLNLVPSGNNVTLNWPLWATNFVLQAAEGGLRPSGTWTNVAVPPSMSSNECRVIVPITGKAMFYRLHRP